MATISPSKLPRTGTAPVGVQMGGKIKTTDASRRPNSSGSSSTSIATANSRPRASRPARSAKLRSISSQGAKRACGDAADRLRHRSPRGSSLPDQGAFASIGKLLAFNGVHHGHQAIFAQVASGAPLPLTYVIVFDVKKKGGTFGT